MDSDDLKLQIRHFSFSRRDPEQRRQPGHGLASALQNHGLAPGWYKRLKFVIVCYATHIAATQARRARAVSSLLDRSLSRSLCAGRRSCDNSCWPHYWLLSKDTEVSVQRMCPLPFPMTAALRCRYSITARGFAISVVPVNWGLTAVCTWSLMARASGNSSLERPWLLPSSSNAPRVFSSRLERPACPVSQSPGRWPWGEAGRTAAAGSPWGLQCLTHASWQHIERGGEEAGISDSLSSERTAFLLL